MMLRQAWQEAGSRAASMVQRSIGTAPALADDPEAEDIFDADPDSPYTTKEKKKKQQREERAALDQADDRQVAEKEKQDNEDDELELRAWWASAEYRTAYQDLCTDMADARKAATHAYEQAVKEEEKTREQFEDARRRALVLADGRRVYFTRDGRRLYGEDDREITNRSAFSEAQGQRSSHPRATTYEDYVAFHDAENQAAAKLLSNRQILERIDALETKVKDGKLTREQLAEAQHEKQDIIDSLTPEARKDYDRLHAARKDANSLSYRAVDPSFASAPPLTEHFIDARSVAVEQQKPTQTPSRAPAYKPAPDYSSPQGQ